MTHRFQVAVLFLAAASVRANTITVNTTADGVGANDGFCTLREAILAANTNTASGAMAGECAAGAAGLDTIEFAIPGAGVKTITPVAPLPAITEALFINGYTQGVASPNTNALNAGINAVILIELNTSSSGGLKVNAAGSTIRGLNLHSGGDAITIQASNVTIAGNFIGTNQAGTVGLGGSNVGIQMNSGDNNVIGGAAAADRNLVSGYRDGSIELVTDNGTLIQGNYIGTDVTGTVSLQDLSATPFGIQTTSGTSNTTVLGNLISGNGTGVAVDLGGGGVIRGNLIGTQRDGVSALGNPNSGIFLAGNGFVVGGTSPGQGNTIAFNGSGVTVQSSFSGDSILGNSIYSNDAKGITLNGNSTPLANDACDADTLQGNKGQNYPAITSASIVAGLVTISGTLNSTASTIFRVEFFSNAACDTSGNGEGKTFLGFANVTTNSTCDAGFGPLVFAVPSGQAIFTATATDPNNNTSEFSACFSAGVAATATPTSTPTPTPTPTSTPTRTSTPTPTNTPAGVATATPTATGVATAVAVPTLSGGMLLLLGASLALMSVLLIRRSG